MKENFVFVFDIGSSKIRAMVAGKGINNTFKEKVYKEIAYDGFFEGEFLNKDNLEEIFQEVADEFSAFTKKIKKVYIGVPAEFSSVVLSDVSLSLGENRKVTKDDIDSLVYMAGERVKTSEVEVISVSPISYNLDGKKTLAPVGECGMNLSAQASIVYANREFIDMFNTLVGDLGFSTVEYISEPLAEALFVLPQHDREGIALLVDSGDISTSIAIVEGDGLKALTSVSRGGGFVTNDLAEAFELSIADAERLKKQVVLSVKGKNTDCYDLAVDGGRTERISLNLANEIVSYRIDELSEVILKCLQSCTEEYVQYLPVYLTGGGISKIKGGRDYLAKCLGRNVSYGVPRLPGKEKPELASVYSLVNWALTNEN